MRPQIEFIHANDMPWLNESIGLERSHVSHKMLSLDNETGEMSVLLHYPPGWHGSTNESLSVDEELYVLTGTLTFGDLVYAEGCYAHLPAGYRRAGESASKEGATVLTFFSGRPSRASDPEDCDASRLIERSSLYEDGWDEDYGGLEAPSAEARGVRKKLLRTDPKNGDQTWVMGLPPSYRENLVEKHPVVQECFMISGELAGNYGLMIEGTYFWRPRDILHGPYGTRIGCTILSRTKGGRLAVDYLDLEEPFSFQPAHRVVLPEHYVMYGQEKQSIRCF